MSPPLARCSILITSAPMSARWHEPYGPAPYCSTARMRRPSRGSFIRCLPIALPGCSCCFLRGRSNRFNGSGSSLKLRRLVAPGFRLERSPAQQLHVAYGQSLSFGCSKWRSCKRSSSIARTRATPVLAVRRSRSESTARHCRMTGVFYRRSVQPLFVFRDGCALSLGLRPAKWTARCIIDGEAIGNGKVLRPACPPLRAIRLTLQENRNRPRPDSRDATCCVRGDGSLGAVHPGNGGTPHAWP